MRVVLGSSFVSGQRWSSRCSTCSSEAISSGVGTGSVICSRPPALRAGGAPTSRKRSSAEPGKPRLDAIVLFAGHLLTGEHLLDDVRGCLREEGVVAEFACGARQLLLRGGQVLFQTASLGGHVDSARRVYLDDVPGPRQPHLDLSRGAERLVALGEPRQ